jgi:hypothetical protein
VVAAIALGIVWLLVRNRRRRNEALLAKPP